MFKALSCEGFARPFEGVRVILRGLVEKYRAAGQYRCAISATRTPCASPSLLLRSRLGAPAAL